MVSPRYALWVALWGGLVLALGCSNPQKRMEGHLERGDAYLAEGNTEAAIVEFKNVVQIDPRDARGRYRLALAYLKLGDAKSRREARNQLAVAVQENPTHLDARLALIELHLAEGDHVRGTDYAQEAVRQAPNDPRSLVLLGRCQLKGKKLKAITTLQKARELDPKSATTRVYLARALMANDQLVAAREELDAAQQLDPKSSMVHVALGDFHALESDYREAEKDYRRALALTPDDEAAFLKLSGLLRRTGQTQAAESIYKKYAAARPNDPTAHIALGSFYAEQNRHREAREQFEKAQQLDPESPIALDKLLGLELSLGNVQRVRDQTEALLRQRADHPIAQYYQARIALRDKKYDEAVKLLRDIVKRHPEIGAAHLTLGTALAANGDREGAARALQRATSGSVASEAYLALARLHLAEGSTDLAVLEARRAHEADPRDVPTLVTYAKALARARQVPDAIRLLAKAQAANPEAPELAHGLGLLTSSQGESELALNHFSQALSTDPAFVPALREMTGIYLKEKRYQDAHAAIDRQLTKVPKSLDYQLLRGRVLEAEGKSVDAERVYIDAMNEHRVASNAYARLAALHLKRGDADAAIEKYREEVKRSPKKLGPHVVLGILLHVRGDIPGARRSYEAALSIDARAAIAANNLASILADEGRELDRALSLAESAYRERPGDANVLDTLGWIYFKKKQYRQAASLLGTAYRLAPSNQVVVYHLGLSLAEVEGRQAEAKKVLEALLAANPTFADADDVRATLAKL